MKKIRRGRKYKFIIYKENGSIEINFIRLGSHDREKERRFDLLKKDSLKEIIYAGEVESDSNNINEYMNTILSVHAESAHIKPAIKTGSIIDYIDDKVHLALVLFYGKEKSFLLFTTTNPDWNPRSRLLTKDEQSLLGFPSRKTTYFAPVIRSNVYMSSTGKYFPEHRIESLQKEFGVIKRLL